MSLTQATRNVIATTGSIIASDGMIYILILSATIFMIASICIPYYTNSSGTSGVYGSGKDCLGYTGQDCMTMHALPIMTILSGFAALFFRCTAHVSLPFLNRLPRIKGVGKMLAAKIAAVEKRLEGVHIMGMSISIPVILFLAMVFAVATLGTQLGTPMSGVPSPTSPSGAASTVPPSSSSLAVQAGNPSNGTTLGNGMALSGVATVFVLCLCIYSKSKPSWKIG